MKIRDWIHAIDLTIERHQAVLDGEYENYETAKIMMKPVGWVHYCPLCEYDATIPYIRACKTCPWIKFKRKTCSRVGFGKNNTTDIKRLEGWKKKLQEEK